VGLAFVTSYIVLAASLAKPDSGGTFLKGSCRRVNSLNKTNLNQQVEQASQQQERGRFDRNIQQDGIKALSGS